MNQNLQGVLQQVQKMLSQLSSHIFQVNSIIKEINKIINQYRHMNVPLFNQMNNLNSMINNNKVNFNQSINPNFNNIRKSQTFQNFKMNIPFNMVNITDGNNKVLNDTLILYLDNETTVNEMLIQFLKKIGREDCINQEIIGFMGDGQKLKFGDQRKIEELFGNASLAFPILVYNINNNFV